MTTNRSIMLRRFLPKAIAALAIIILVWAYYSASRNSQPPAAPSPSAVAVKSRLAFPVRRGEFREIEKLMDRIPAGIHGARPSDEDLQPALRDYLESHDFPSWNVQRLIAFLDQLHLWNSTGNGMLIYQNALVCMIRMRPDFIISNLPLLAGNYSPHNMSRALWISRASIDPSITASVAPDTRAQFVILILRGAADLATTSEDIREAHWITMINPTEAGWLEIKKAIQHLSTSAPLKKGGFIGLPKLLNTTWDETGRINRVARDVALERHPFGLNPGDVEAWLGGRGYIPEFADAFARGAVAEDPARGLDLAITISRPDSRERIIGTLMKEWLAVEPIEAINAARYQLKGNDLVMAAKEIAAHLTTTHQESASAACQKVITDHEAKTE